MIMTARVALRASLSHLAHLTALIIHRSRTLHANGYSYGGKAALQSHILRSYTKRYVLIHVTAVLCGLLYPEAHTNGNFFKNPHDQFPTLYP
jgi:hypothetical protein